MSFTQWKCSGVAETKEMNAQDEWLVLPALFICIYMLNYCKCSVNGTLMTNFISFFYYFLYCNICTYVNLPYFSYSEICYAF